MSETKNEGGWVYLLGPFLGAVAGCIQIKFGDLLLTALVVMAFTMLLGILRPKRPWRWMVLVAVFVLLSQGAAYFFLTERSSREQIFESMLGFLTGTVGAYAGSLFRRALSVFTEGK
jgi:ABC-type multidrug transport system permease subunit